jgi:RNA polymerase sigma-70 factor (ECF subfamily)
VTDEELVLLARQGDTSAFDALVVRHQTAVYRAALAALRRPDDAEEVAQDTFVRAWLKIQQFRARSSFKTWILTIAWNRAMSRRRSLTAWWRRVLPLEEARIVHGKELAPDDAVGNRELHASVSRAIEALTPKLRDTLLLAQSGEYQYEEIALMLKVPVGTVKWRVTEARRKVRQRLVDLGYADEP